VTSLEGRIWELERDVSGDEALAIAKSAALVRLDEDELEVVEQVLASVEEMETQQELWAVLEVLEASFGDIPRLNLEKYATFAEEEYRLLQQQREGGS
jgi:hypothetical protein